MSSKSLFLLKNCIKIIFVKETTCTRAKKNKLTSELLIVLFAKETADGIVRKG